MRFPGRYTLVLRDEQLTSPIQPAGGLTSQAYANGIRFFRTEGGGGHIAVDLPQVLRDPSFRDNLVLADGDSIHIPRYIPTLWNDWISCRYSSSIPQSLAGSAAIIAIAVP